ncbi:hypothetical protein DPMN_119671 [Dreissena polymorpha]|uniref:Uncharacterized protein n=1 Tax=Dreissena polymorpha TaxID=45954 RepID=A0A9D4JMZ3_DREPO|nr:hypothetical protein DPMN_119671 [Dreissena polymorpha]
MGDQEGQFDTKLHEAVRYGDIAEVKVALQQGYDPNLIGLYQWNTLHEASHNGETEILQLLLQKKGDPNKADYLQSRTAMHYASEKGHVTCLQMLLEAGGRYDIKDADGKDSLDLATPTCRKILEKLKMKDLMLNSDKDADDTSMVSDEGIASDRTSLVSSRRSSIESFKDKGPGLGYLHMSVEYHSTKSTLKLRIWQLTDLLLPPSNTSMIHSIYVKSYLQPDKKKDSKRKTEEVKVDQSEGHIHWRRKKVVAIQHVFTPSTFKFSRPLEYAGITAEHIKERNLQIEVCITQRYSHRSFLIGMVRMSLRSAVKKVVKEKLSLIPCMNHTIPANMKVYSASQLDISSDNTMPGGEIFFSNPNVRIVLPEDADNASDKAASNPDLQRRNDSVLSPSTEVDMSSHYRFVSQVPKLDLSNMALDESGYSSEIHVSLQSGLESPDSNSSSSNFSSTVNIAELYESKKTKPVHVLEGIKEDKSHHLDGYSDKKNKVDSAIEITDIEDESIELVTMVSDGTTTFSRSKQESSEEETQLEIKVESKASLKSSKHQKQTNFDLFKKKPQKTDTLSGNDSSDVEPIGIKIDSNAQLNIIKDISKLKQRLSGMTTDVSANNVEPVEIKIEANTLLDKSADTKRKQRQLGKKSGDTDTEPIEIKIEPNSPIEVSDGKAKRNRRKLGKKCDESSDAKPLTITIESNSKQDASIEISKVKYKKSNEKSDDNSAESRSRSESPQWDFYDIPSEVVVNSTETTASPWKEGAAPVILPMETTMGIPNTKEFRSSFSRNEHPESGSKKNKNSPKPGHAVPVVPSIIVTKPSFKGKQGESRNLVEDFSVNIPESLSKQNQSNTITRSESAEMLEGNIRETKQKDVDVKKEEKMGLKKLDRKAFVNVGKAISKKPEVLKSQLIKNDTEQIADSDSKVSMFKSRLRKLRIGKESKYSESKVIVDKAVPSLSANTGAEIGLTGVKVERSEGNVKSKTSHVTRRAERTASSVFIDMERLSLQSSGAHVIELIEEDISITELDDNDPLFTDRSEATTFQHFTDIESGFGDYKLPQCKSPTQYMVPMHKRKIVAMKHY